METPLSPSQKGAEPPIFGPCLLWPNSWMDQADTWHGGRPQPRRLCIRWGLSPLPNFWPISIVASPLPQKGDRASPIFGPCLFRPNGCMDQDATWYEGRPPPRRHCVRWGPSCRSSKKGAELPPQFFAHVCCDQTAGWIKMALGMEVGLGPGRIVLDEAPAPLPKKGAGPPIFGPFLL